MIKGGRKGNKTGKALPGGRDGPSGRGRPKLKARKIDEKQTGSKTNQAGNGATTKRGCNDQLKEAPPPLTPKKW